MEILFSCSRSGAVRSVILYGCTSGIGDDDVPTHYSATGSQDTFSDRPVLSTVGPRRLDHARANLTAYTTPSIHF